MTAAPTTWVVCDDKQGVTNQCVGVAEAVGADPVVKHSRPRLLWRLLPAAVWPMPLAAQRADADPLAPPWPDLLITCGRTSFAPAVEIKRRAAGRTVLIAIQNPRMALARFDLVIAPAHDRVSGPNVLVTDGAVHRVTPARLSAAAPAVAARLTALGFGGRGAPIAAVLIGGSNSAYKLDAAVAADLGARLAAFARTHGVALAVTPSRRTPPAVVRAFRDALAGVPAFLWDGTGENPYFGLLGIADAVIVTADSVSMISEAAVTGKPIYVLPLPGPGGKFAAFQDHMTRRGIIRPFTGAFERWTYAPLDDMARAAAAIRGLLDRRDAMAHTAAVPAA